MNEIGEKYLPVGTVVILKGAVKRLMIIGYSLATVDDPQKVYDYAGCLYPEGMLSSKANALFNHDQIEKIYSLGYSDKELEVFMEKLKKMEEEKSNE